MKFMTFPKFSEENRQEVQSFIPRLAKAGLHNLSSRERKLCSELLSSEEVKIIILSILMVM